MSNLSNLLEPIAAWFRDLGVPDPIVHWGHPAMMGIVVLVMGSVVGMTGWRGRQLTDLTESTQSRADHRKIAPLMLLFIVLGYTGGVLSLVMQHQPILESPHFWTGSAAVGLLVCNSAIAKFGFSQGNTWRTAHAYLGSGVLCLLFLHIVLGVKLGLAI